LGVHRNKALKKILGRWVRNPHVVKQQSAGGAKKSRRENVVERRRHEGRSLGKDYQKVCGVSIKKPEMRGDYPQRDVRKGGRGKKTWDRLAKAGGVHLKGKKKRESFGKGLLGKWGGFQKAELCAEVPLK